MHFELGFANGMRYKSRGFLNGCPTDSTPFVEKIVLSSFFH